MLKKIHLAKYYGFCMGVKRAITIAEDTAKAASGNVTILKEIVHNDAVVRRFSSEGVGQAMSVDNVNDGTLIISAHGISPDVITSARGKGLQVVDATCPLVTRIYDIIHQLVKNDHYIIHFGDPNHDETNGVMGHAPDRITLVENKSQLSDLPDWRDRKLGITIQTTADMEEALEFQKLAGKKWPHAEFFDTICNATNQRQTAIMDMAPSVELILVVGSTTSANSKRLASISKALCGKGHLINSAEDINEEWFADSERVENVGISAGASTPEFLVEEVIERLKEISGGRAEVFLPEKKRRRSNQKTEEVH
jgi:4-hydroxy-3-methylbut-2-enyl diphosphate reductase